MDLSSNFDNAGKVPRHIQLYNLAFKKKPQDPDNKQTRPKKRRHQIEIDLMERYLKSQAKIHNRKILQSARISERITGVPKINNLKKFKAILSTEEERKTVKRNQISESLRKKISKPEQSSDLILLSDTALSQSSLTLSVDLSKLGSFKRPSRKAMENTPRDTLKESPRCLSSSSFHNLGTLNSQPDERLDLNTSYSELEGTIANRTQIWKSWNNDKLVKQRQEKFNREINECSFKPDLSATLHKTNSKTLKNSSAEATNSYSYTNLVSSTKVIAYSAGINWNGFNRKAKPMVDYKNMTQKT